MALNALLLVQLAYALLCAGAAVQDWRSRTIANAWSIALVALAMLAFLLMPKAAGIGSHLASFAIVLVVGIGLFAIGWLGGGDAKLAAAAALAFRVGDLFAFVFAIVLLGGLVALLSMMRPGTMKERRERRIPYGVPIALAAIWSAFRLGVYI